MQISFKTYFKTNKTVTGLIIFVIPCLVLTILLIGSLISPVSSHVSSDVPGNKRIILNFQIHLENENINVMQML